MSGLLDQIGAIADRFSELHAPLVAVAIVLHVGNHLLRSLAWRNVLGAAYPNARVPLLGVASAYALGVGLNALLPARGGDAVKLAVVRARLAGSSLATIASTMSVVVLFDLAAATVLVVAVGATGALPLAPELPARSALFWLVAALAVGVAVALIGRRLTTRGCVVCGSRPGRAARSCARRRATPGGSPQCRPRRGCAGSASCSVCSPPSASTQAR